MTYKISNISATKRLRFLHYLNIFFSFFYSKFIVYGDGNFRYPYEITIQESLHNSKPPFPPLFLLRVTELGAFPASLPHVACRHEADTISHDQVSVPPMRKDVQQTINYVSGPT